ncbi:dihydrodipicolinate synthase family protein [bacterium]|nr:dihydrodipicolinate synthase family protein [bacterium]
MALNLEGIFPALTTPFEDTEIALDKLKENILKYNKHKLSGYVVLGSTGEAVYVNDEESELIVKSARETSSPEKKIIVGTARESTRFTLEFTNRMADLGVDAALVRTPSYFRAQLDREALKYHFLTLADKSRIPIIIYNIPQNTGVSMDKELVVELSIHPQIIGIKDSSGNLSLPGEILPAVNPQFNYILGAGSLLLPGFLLGVKGGILTLADVVPELCVKLFELFREGKMEEAHNLQLSLIPLNKAITRTYGVPAAKYAMDLVGYYGGPPRSPLRPLDEKEKQTIRELVEKLQ